jgi:hypothetical protein
MFNNENRNKYGNCKPFILLINILVNIKNEGNIIKIYLASFALAKNARNIIDNIIYKYIDLL